MHRRTPASGIAGGLDTGSSGWVWVLGAAFILCLPFEILEWIGRPRDLVEWLINTRIFDILLFLSAGGFGIAVAHFLIKRSMAMTNARLHEIVDESLADLEDKLKNELAKGVDEGEKGQIGQQQTGQSQSSQAQSAAPTKEQPSPEQIPFPIPYIVSRLGDMNPGNFGYFGGKLVSRDPRLLLDLSLDLSLTGEQSDKIWELKQRITNANKKPEKPATHSDKTKSESETSPVETTLKKPAETTPAAGVPKEAAKEQQTPTASIRVALKILVGLVDQLRALQKKMQSKDIVTSETWPGDSLDEDEEDKK